VLRVLPGVTGLILVLPSFCFADSLPFACSSPLSLSHNPRPSRRPHCKIPCLLVLVVPYCSSLTPVATNHHVRLHITSAYYTRIRVRPPVLTPAFDPFERAPFVRRSRSLLSLYSHEAHACDTNPSHVPARSANPASKRQSIEVTCASQAFWRSATVNFST
jgi:hypothetical protein